jgi:hypothetical protein
LSKTETLESLESLLESFLDRVVTLKENRLSVIEGISELDDIARKAQPGDRLTDSIGDWFAGHNRWLTEGNLKPVDVQRITGILGEIRKELKINAEATPARRKIETEIDRWQQTEQELTHRVVLKRGPETAADQTTDVDSITLFDNKLDFLARLYKDHAGNKKHILTVLDDLLKAARVQANKDALILSAFIIYYLKHNGYKVEPYVRKLKEAETNFRAETFNAQQR